MPLTHLFPTPIFACVVSNSSGLKVKVEEVSEEEGEEDTQGKEVGPGSDLQIVNVMEFEVTPCHSHLL
jgi:hypothetical protein